VAGAEDDAGGNLAGGGESQVVSGRAVKADGGVFGLTEVRQWTAVSTNGSARVGREEGEKNVYKRVERRCARSIILRGSDERGEPREEQR